MIMSMSIVFYLSSCLFIETNGELIKCGETLHQEQLLHPQQTMSKEMSSSLFYRYK